MYEHPPIMGQIFRTLGATKLDPNALESASPTDQGVFTRLTLKNPAVVGTTLEQALTYSIPLLDLLGFTTTIGWEDLCRLVLLANEAAPTDLRIWAGLSEGVVASANRGLAIGIAYEAGNWRIYRAVNVSGAGWGAGAAAANTSASTRGGIMSMQFSATTNNGTHGNKIVDSAEVPISGTNFSLQSAVAMNAPVFSHVFIGADWVTGAGGSAGETIDFKVVAECLKLTTIPNHL